MNTSTPFQARTLAWPLMLLAGIGIGWASNIWWSGRHPHGDAMPAAASPDAASSVASAQATARQPLYWYDPMVPNQHFDKPGKSPFMDMELVPKYADAGGSATPGISVDSRVAQSLGLRLAPVAMRDLSAHIGAVGVVQLNERDVSIVQSRTAGFVQRTYAHAPGDVVAQGAPLADVLVPDWAAAQAEYLAVKRTGDTALAQASRQRLALLGMPFDLIARVDQTSQAQTIYTIMAPAGGVIQELMVRQGMTVSPGMTLARLNGIASVWIDTAVPESQVATIKAGTPVTVTMAAYPAETFTGTVKAFLPEGNRDSRTQRLRIELPNGDGRLKAGMSAQVNIQGQPNRVLAIPAEAVIRTGQRALVYVADEAPASPNVSGRYSPVEIQLGAESQGYVEVRQGLREGQHVVASGPFLIDSEASLQGLTPAAASTASQPMADQAAKPSEPVYEGMGRITQLSGDAIELQHEPIPALKWGAMTMPFQVRKGAVPQGTRVGDQVRFRFTMGDDGPVIQSIQPMQAAPSTQPRKGGQP